MKQEKKWIIKNKDRGENKMKGPKEKLFCFPMECKYGSITLKKDENLYINKVVKEDCSFNSLSEIRTFLRNKAKEKNCEILYEKKGISSCCGSAVYISYYSDNNGQYNKDGEFITYHVIKIFYIGKNKINIENFFEYKASEYQTIGLQFLIDNIWSL